MPASRQPGMDQSHYDWSYLPARPKLSWGGETNLVVNFVISMEYFDIDPPADSKQSAWLTGGLGPRPFPNYACLSHREYGHRVGIFRILQSLGRHGITPTIALDGLTARNYPWLVERLVASDADIIGHGMAVTRLITSAMSVEQERAYIEESLAAVESVTGLRPVGWLSPDQSESEHTPQLLDEAGVRYVCDWSNDEQPYRMNTPSRLLSLPLTLEFDTAFALSTRGMLPDNYERMVIRGLNQMTQEGADSGLLAMINLHPWIIGQPFRIGTLDKILEHVAGLSAATCLTTGKTAQKSEDIL